MKHTSPIASIMRRRVQASRSIITFRSLLFTGGEVPIRSAIVGFFVLAAACLAVGADAPLVRLEQHEFGKTPDGATVQQFTLRNAKGMTAKIITYGAIIAD